MTRGRACVLFEGGRFVLLEQRLEGECCAVAWKTQQGLSTLQGFVCLVEYFTLFILGSHLRCKWGIIFFKKITDQDVLKVGKDILIYQQLGEEWKIASNSLDMHCICRSKTSKHILMHKSFSHI